MSTVIKRGVASRLGRARYLPGMPTGKPAAGGTEGGNRQYDWTLFRRRTTDRMEELGWTQQDLADRAGMTQGAISRYLNGHREPLATAILSIAIALEVTTDQLLATEIVKRRPRRSVTPPPESGTTPSSRKAG